MPDTNVNTNDNRERRRHTRTQLQMNLQCIRLDPDEGDVITMLDTVDISRGGLGAMSDHAFYPGQRVVLCMPLTTMGGRRNIYASVIRCRQEELGYNIGFEFDASAMSMWRPETPAYAAA